MSPEQEGRSLLIVGIDPGRANTGYCKLYYDAVTLEIVEIIPRTITEKDLYVANYDILRFGVSQATMFAHRENFINLFKIDRPSHICCESPFFNKATPSAFRSLSYFLANLFIAVEKALTSTPLDLVDPPTAKKAIGAKGNAKKEDVLKAMEKIPELVDNCEITLKDLDEHSLDSMAIAYYRLQNLRNSSI